MLFLDSITDDTDASILAAQSNDLIDFVAVLEMGAFYSKKIGEMIKMPNRASVSWIGGPSDPNEEFQEQQRSLQHAQEYRDQLRQAQKQVYALAIELLRFQKW
jgi:hypothetical protein